MDVNAVIKDVTGKTVSNPSQYYEAWLSWYRGDVIGFHNYKIYNGENEIELRRKTLNMAKQVAESWANMLVNEKCDIVLPEKPKVVFDSILKRSNFWLKLNEGVEKSFALSLGAMYVNVVGLMVGEVSKVMKKDKAYVTVDFVDRTKIIPITTENKIITECAFVSVNSDSTNIVVHMKQDNGNYAIHNVKLSLDGKIVDRYEFDTKSSIAWFQIIRPNIANNIMTSTSDTELGISIYANSIDTLKAIDAKYDGFDFEFIGGRKRVFVATEAWNFKANTDGSTTKVRSFDLNNQLFYSLPVDANGNNMVTVQTDQLRHESFIQGINAELALLSMKCGMGETYYKFNGSGVMTATQVISENSTLYRNLKKHEILMEHVLLGLADAIIYASNEFTNEPVGVVNNAEIKIIFDDSIIEDKASELVRDRADVASGLMGHVEYRMKWYGEDETTALSNIRKYSLYVLMNQYMPALQSGAMTPEDYCIAVYGEVKPERVEYIKEFMTSSPQLDMTPLYEGKEE